MKIAFLHFELSSGPTEHNLEKLIDGIEKAAQEGAEWIITPEVALQGYFFAERNSNYESMLVTYRSLQKIEELAKKHAVHIYFCYAELEEKTGKKYNSCSVFNNKGLYIATQRKISGHNIGAEAWSSHSKRFKLLETAGLLTGILICSDSWYIKNAEIARALNADLIVVPAAWNDFDCGGMPESIWQRCSTISNAPLWICNQTGPNDRLDFSNAKSAVVCGNKTRLCYSGAEAILFFEWDEKANSLNSTKFLVSKV